MRKTVTALVMAATLTLSGLGFAATASAAPYYGEGCEKVRGTIICTDRDYLGSSGNYKESTTYKKGSENSSHEKQCTYKNPGGNMPAGKQGC